MKLLNRSLTALTAFGAFLSAGCYSYMPVETGMIPPGEEVRVVLTRPAFASLPEIPTISGPDLNGRVVSSDAQQVLMRVPVTYRSELGVASLSQEVAVPAAGIVEFKRRQFNPTRTAFAVAAGMTVASALINGFKGGGRPNTSDPERVIDEEAGVGFSFSIGLP